ncbi:histidine--tRNA ligase [Demequina sp. B12]|uniref:histidine--tRNA ligase n=1 Tax=Demequina sp. B12 TaxID=2992757 RepID=UPI00237A8A05|nr:histidine--tRNA ligase [Demequina sp. B12]MDE0573031.1 histidine--tRNA ligase [Demequina sp. B12]
MARVRPLSGYPEWTPSQRVVETQVLAAIAEVFEVHGFGEIQTRAVETLERLAGKSEASKEIYTLGRLNADDDAEAKVGLHFDLTVPFARYVEEFQNDLQFPFRRYQIQKVWRGERPQEGRFREFYQADIDVVARDVLAPHFEVEVAVVMARALAALPVPGARMHVNNRQLVEGFYRGVGIDDVADALRSVDKLDKIGPDGVRAELADKGVGESAADAILELARISAADASFAAAIEDLWATTTTIAEVADAEAQLKAGIAALVELVEGVNAAVPGTAVADLRIARGLDYYTGSVYETFLTGHEDLGSICSGGRYDSLVAGGGFPGVGMSIGVSRLVSRMLSAGLASASRGVPSAVMVAVTDEDTRGESVRIADRLRARGVACEVSPKAAKFGKQIQLADKRGIPFVWFPASVSADAASPVEGDGEVKDIRSGEQVPADADVWLPPAADARPRIVS